MRALIKKAVTVFKARLSGVDSPCFTPAENQTGPLRERYITRKGFIINDLVSSCLPANEKFSIIDGGARDAHADPRWRVIDPKRIRIFGFEPDSAEVARLNQEAKEKNIDYHYYDGALWSKRTNVTFYENKSPGGGSCFPQNTALTDRWKFENHQQLFLAKDIFYPIGTSEWQTTSLNDWSGQTGHHDIDFMKLNVQGAELEILQGASLVLDRVVGIMTEVSFVESYRNRPFFSDIDSYLRARHFEFFDLIGLHYMGRMRSPITARHQGGLYPLWGQLIEAHGIYFRDPIAMELKGISIDHLSKDKLLKLASLAEIFGQIEYAFELLDWLAGLLERRGDLQGSLDVKALVARAEENYRKYTT